MKHILAFVCSLAPCLAQAPVEPVPRPTFMPDFTYSAARAAAADSGLADLSAADLTRIVQRLEGMLAVRPLAGPLLAARLLAAVSGSG